MRLTPPADLLPHQGPEEDLEPRGPQPLHGEEATNEAGLPPAGEGVRLKPRRLLLLRPLAAGAQG